MGKNKRIGIVSRAGLELVTYSESIENKRIESGQKPEKRTKRMDLATYTDTCSSIVWSVYWRGKFWWYRFSFDGVRYFRSSRSADRSEAERMCVEHIENLLSGKTPEERPKYLYMDHGWVYFIQCTVTKRIKIGWSKSGVEGRLRSIQVGSPTRLVILKSIRARYVDERRFHDIFRDRWMHGEWHESSPEMEQYIAALEDRTGDFTILPPVFHLPPTPEAE